MEHLNKNSDEEAPLLSSTYSSEMSIHEKMSTSQVYPLIWTIRRDITKIIETPFSWEQLQSPHITYNVVQILALKYGSLYHQNLAVGAYPMLFYA